MKIIGFIILLALLLWYVFGESPTFEQLLLGVLFVNVGFSFKIFGDTRELKGKLEEHLRIHESKRPLDIQSEFSES